MIKSMTGYGRCEDVVNGVRVVVEMKSVNHRYFEFSCRVPRAFAFVEDKLKALIQARISRGKLDAFVTIDTGDVFDTSISINHTFTKGYVAALTQLAEVYGLKDDISVSLVARNPEVFNIKNDSIDEKLVWEAVSSVAERALESLVCMREAEGKSLVKDINSRIDFIKENVEKIEKRSPETVREYREKIEQKIKELVGDIHIDEQRLLAETAIFADRIAVAEETVRLNNHMQQLRTLLCNDGPVGRKADFIVQEMNREANTTGSKSQDLQINRIVVDIKSEIEKIREQIQNIE